VSDVSFRDRTTRAVALRQAGIAAARAGRKVEARRYLHQSIALDDGVEETWLWLAWVAVTPQESLACLRRALAINPHNRRAQAGLRWARQRLNQQGGRVRPPTQAAPAANSAPAFVSRLFYHWRYWAGVVLVVWLAVLLIGGFLLTSLGAGNPVVAWPLPTPTATFVPGTPTLTTSQQIEALYAPLQAAWEAKDWPECVRVLDSVLALEPKEQTAQAQRLLALTYLTAQESYKAQAWEKAIFQFQALLGLDDDYLDARDLLYRSYYQLGLARQAAGELTDAKIAYEQALAVREDGNEAQAALAEVNFLLTPPTPTPVPKRIEVYIGQQRMYVYEGGRLIWDWVVSTGEPGRDTRTGHFEVLDKIPNAYAVRWDLQMPHWLGIYYAGASENGIHALPILSNGQRLWAGFLGRRVSYGCIILGVEEARLLYEWAEVGTPVDIYP
jgi:tetratricopeptide (TPR) repeat protein